jgi:hypothetical protein
MLLELARKAKPARMRAGNSEKRRLGAKRTDNIK